MIGTPRPRRSEPKPAVERGKEAKLEEVPLSTIGVGKGSGRATGEVGCEQEGATQA